VSRILFVMLHPGFIRYYEDALLALAAAGHHVHVAFEISRDKLGESVLAQRLAASSPRITCGTTPPRPESVRDFLARADRTATRSGERRIRRSLEEAREEAWESLATTVRLMVDYLRFFDPAFAHAEKLRSRAEKRLPRVYAPLVRLAGRSGARAWFGAALNALEEAIPANAAVEAFVREQRPDLLLVTPLIELGSQQVDYVKCARRLGIRTALCVASWDNLTSKGLVRVIPDHVVVWNEAQKKEAVTLHGVPPERVAVTGAQLFDRWFDARPGRTREEFCRDVGLDPGRPFVLYVGSSIFIAPDEVPFVERWISRLRHSGDRAVASLGVLVRPHPANSRQWRTLDVSRWSNVAIWPPIGSDPNAPDFRRDYFDSLYHSAGVVGINTSAQLEAGIVGRAVFTIRTPEFAHAQEGTLHFQHLVSPEGGLVQSAGTLDEHVEQLARTLRGEWDAGEQNRRFVRSFIRPFGEDVPAVPVFARAIASFAALPAPDPRGERKSALVLRPCVYAVACAARALAEDRPLWVYGIRPFLAVGVHAAALAYKVRTFARERARLFAKRLRRTARRAWHESSRVLAKRWRRAQGRAKRAVAAASSAHRKG